MMFSWTRACEDDVDALLCEDVDVDAYHHLCIA
mgnify:CR=1 FL=1